MNRVLVLDNDRTLRTLMGHALARAGLEAVPAATAEEGEAALDAVAAVLMDFHLGAGRDGAEVLLAWAERRGGLPPCWVVTGTPEHPGLAALADFAPLRRVVGKPFSVLELAEEVAAALREPAAAATAGAAESVAAESVAAESVAAEAVGAGAEGPAAAVSTPRAEDPAAWLVGDPVGAGFVRALLEPLSVVLARRARDEAAGAARRPWAEAGERAREAGA